MASPSVDTGIARTSRNNPDGSLSSFVAPRQTAIFITSAAFPPAVVCGTMCEELRQVTRGERSEANAALMERNCSNAMTEITLTHDRQDRQTDVITAV